MNHRKAGRLSLQARHKALDGLGRAFQLQLHSVTLVTDPPFQVELRDQPVDIGSKPYALDNANNDQPDTLQGYSAFWAAAAAALAALAASAFFFISANCSGVNLGLGGAFLMNVARTMKSSGVVPTII